MRSDKDPADMLLDALLLTLHYVPDHANELRSADDLPVNLRLRARSGEPWRAWIDDVRIWFVSGRRITKAGDPIIHAEFFDVDGRFMAGGVWRRSRSTGWVLECPEGQLFGRASHPGRQLAVPVGR